MLMEPFIDTVAICTVTTHVIIVTGFVDAGALTAARTAMRVRHKRENPGVKLRIESRNTDRAWLTSASSERPFDFSTLPRSTP